MTDYAKIENGGITLLIHEPLGPLQIDGRSWDFRDPAVRAAWRALNGYTLVVEVPRPADTDEGTYQRSVELVDGVPTEVWTPRPWTPEELAARAAAAQYEADRLTVKQIVTDLRAEKARAQAVIDTPNSTIKANPAPYVVDVARAAKRIADAAIDLARYVAP